MLNDIVSLPSSHPFAILAVKRCISAVAFGRMAGVLTSIDRSSSTFLFWNENMIFSWRILMRVVILILPVVLGWVSGVATPSRDVDRGYSDGPTNFNSYRRMYVRRFFVFHSLTFVLVFDTLRSPDVSGLASDEAALAPVARGGCSDCRELSSFLILFWTCVKHVRYLYRVWAFFIFWYTCFTGCVGLNIQRGGTSTGCPHWIFRLTGSCRRMYVGFFRLRVACIVKGREVWYITIMICRCGGRYGFFKRIRA